jgi:hypothetical protein
VYRITLEEIMGEVLSFQSDSGDSGSESVSAINENAEDFPGEEVAEKASAVGKVIDRTGKADFKSSKTAKPPNKGKILVKDTTSDIEKITGDKSETGEQLDIFKKELEAELEKKPDEDKKEEDEDENEDILNELDINSKASKRIRQLVQKRKEVEAKAQQAEKAQWEYYNYAKQEQEKMQNEYYQMREAYAAMKAKMELFETQRFNPQYQQQQMQEDLDPAEKIRREWVDSLKKEIYEKEISPIKQQLEEQQRAQQEAREQAELYRSQQNLKNTVIHNVKNVVLKGFPQEMMADLGPQAENYVLTNIANGMEPAEAAKAARRFFLTFASGYIKAMSAPNMEQQSASRSVPRPLPQGKSAAFNPQGASPSQEQLRFNGFKDEPDWLIHGRPALKPLPRS